MSYLFSALFLVFMIMFFMLFYMSNMLFLKYLVILVYVSGVVVFILYISCMCWHINEKFSFFYLFFLFMVNYFLDMGLYVKFEIGEFMWMYLFFAFLFNSLIMSYSLNLFKISGSLRF